MSTQMQNLREGLAANITASIPDGINVAAYRQASPVMPSVQVTGLDEMEATAFGAGGYTLTFVVQAFAGGVSERGAQMLLDGFLFPTGDLSIWAALESDRTLGGAAASSTVLRCEGVQLLTVNGNDVLGSSWFVQVEI